jgi:hypothetical protein
MRPARARCALSWVISRTPPRLKPTSRGSTSERRTPASAPAFSRADRCADRPGGRRTGHRTGHR